MIPRISSRWEAIGCDDYVKANRLSRTLLTAVGNQGPSSGLRVRMNGHPASDLRRSSFPIGTSRSLSNSSGSYVTEPQSAGSARSLPFSVQ